MILNRKLIYDYRFFKPARKYPLQYRLNIFENGIWSKVGQHKARNIIAVGLEACVLPALESDYDLSHHWLTSYFRLPDSAREVTGGTVGVDWTKEKFARKNRNKSILWFRALALVGGRRVSMEAFGCHRQTSRPRGGFARVRNFLLRLRRTNAGDKDLHLATLKRKHAIRASRAQYRRARVLKSRSIASLLAGLRAPF